MASLVEKVFMTMPLSGTIGYLAGQTGVARQAKLGYLAGCLRFIEDPSEISVDAKYPSAAAQASAKDGDTLRIWGWTDRMNGPVVEKITCRVREDDFKPYVVLDKLEWGYNPDDDPSALKPAVRVTLAGHRLELPLEERFRLMTFVATMGRNRASESFYFPLEARHDPSLVHVYAFDILPIGRELQSLKDPKHPQRSSIDLMLNTCRSINQIDPGDDTNYALDYLFSDDLWQPAPDPYAEGMSALTAPICSIVEVGTASTRVLVALCLTPCKERDDFVPARVPYMMLLGMGRLYPQIMTVANAPLELVESAIRMTRPKETTIVDDQPCGCGEMLPEIKSGLWTDTNAGNSIITTKIGAPTPPFWDEIFNYYVIDPDKDVDIAGKRFNVVRRGRGAIRDVQGLVSRDTTMIANAFFKNNENQERVLKSERQGAFDNIHLAPRMVVRQTITEVEVETEFEDPARFPFTSYADWKMDEVAMAPFCAHDCFHVHVRWGDAPGSQTSTKGWSRDAPYVLPGGPMVPWNHDVFFVIPGPNTLLYIDEARDVLADAWQISCYHGTCYGLKIGWPVEQLQEQLHWFTRETFYNVNKEVVGKWAVFYWRLRYGMTFYKKGAPLQVVERLALKDKMTAVNK